MVAGCASTHPQQVAALLDPFVGHSLSEVADRLGPPSSNFATSDIFMTFQWEPAATNCRILVEAAPVEGDVESVPPFQLYKWIVKSWSASGSGCK
jgi:hypothetical protein